MTNESSFPENFRVLPTPPQRSIHSAHNRLPVDDAMIFPSRRCHIKSSRNSPNKRASTSFLFLFSSASPMPPGRCIRSRARSKKSRYDRFVRSLLLPDSTHTAFGKVFLISWSHHSQEKASKLSLISWPLRGNLK